MKVDKYDSSLLVWQAPQMIGTGAPLSMIIKIKLSVRLSIGFLLESGQKTHGGRALLLFGPVTLLTIGPSDVLLLIWKVH